MKTDLMRHAMITYARDCYRRNDNPYTAEQWVAVMNSYAHRLKPDACAKAAEITPLEASLLYCRFSIMLSETALNAARS